MSYSICRIAKIKASGVTGIQIHDRREKDGISHSNQDIDWTKTNENIDLLEQQERFRTVVNQKISELQLKRKPRSDATVMCQCLVTSDNEFFDKMTREEQIKYFQKSYDFIKERYGEKNLVSATIHFDERTPHMHVNFVPITEDGRLSAKELFSPKSLRVLQDDYNRFVRENGYELERGQIDSKTKHLEVEEYKLETRYNELKEKEKVLEKLEEIDTKVVLQAEKGKLTYSTREVEEIKEQNLALRLDNSKKANTINDLQKELHRTQKELIWVQKGLKGMEQPLEHLKDLESENRALQVMRERNPNLDKEMKLFDKLTKQAYDYGNKLSESKNLYHKCLDERERMIQRTSDLEKSAQICENQISDLKTVETNISYSLEQENALFDELEGLKGLFKKKAREECQNKLEEQKNHTEKLLNYLKTEHNTDFEHIDGKIQEYITQAHDFRVESKECKKVTDNLELTMTDTVKNYKFIKGLSEIQQVDLKDISSRIDNKVKLRAGEEGLFRLNQANRNDLLKQYEGKLEPSMIEKFKQYCEKQTASERQARENNKTKVKGKEKRQSIDRSFER